jgi:hypothetical protein
MPPGRPSLLGVVVTRMNYRTPSTASYLRKKDKFKASRVKKDVPKMDMVHHQDVMVELSACLLAAQREIESLRTQLRNSNATI